MTIFVDPPRCLFNSFGLRVLYGREEKRAKKEETERKRKGEKCTEDVDFISYKLGFHIIYYAKKKRKRRKSIDYMKHVAYM